MRKVVVAAFGVASLLSACSGNEDAALVNAEPSTPGRTTTTAVSTATTFVTTSAESPATTGAAAPPAVESMPCDPVPSDPARVTCWLLPTPARHSNPTGPGIHIDVAVVAPTEEAAGQPPLVMLAGGPGFGSLGDIEQVLTGSWDRTVVLVDYRGVGLAHPSLACPEVDDLTLGLLSTDESDPASRALYLGSLQACHDRLVGGKIDLAAFNYTEIAADLADLRIALGYPVWDLYGVSNGGRVALEVLRRHPEGIRSRVLDAAAPPQGNLRGELWPHAQRAFDVLFDGCQSSPTCAAAYPNLGITFSQLVNDLAAKPVDVAVNGPEGPGSVTVKFTASTVINALRGALYETTLIPLLPFFISELAAGRGYEQVAQLIADRSIAPRFSEGMSLSVECQEEVAFLPDGFFGAQAAQLPLLAPAISVDRSVDGCRIWDVGRADPSIESPVISDVPTLLLVGQYDPVHPRPSSEEIASGLSNSTLVEFPGLGHGTFGASPCPDSVMSAFLHDPAAPVDATCAIAMPPPAWVLP